MSKTVREEVALIALAGFAFWGSFLGACAVSGNGYGKVVWVAPCWILATAAGLIHRHVIRRNR